MPTICGNCNTCVERINQHLNHVHQIGRGTTKMQKIKKKRNSKKFTRKFEINFSKIETQSEEELSQEEESDKNQSNKEETLSKKRQKK